MKAKGKEEEVRLILDRTPGAPESYAPSERFTRTSEQRVEEGGRKEGRGGREKRKRGRKRAL